MNNNAPHWYGETAQSIAPVSMMMAIFLLVYSIWFGFAWGLFGWVIFGLTIILAFFLTTLSIKQMKHAKSFPKKVTEEGKRIGKAMGVLSGISYGVIWIGIILFFVIGKQIYILPFVTLIIGLHFIPQAKIFNRKIDYLLAPLPILSSLTALYFIFRMDASWQTAFAIAGIGGALSTASYGVYLLITYKKLALENEVEYK